MKYNYESYVGKTIWELDIIKLNEENLKPTFTCRCSCGRTKDILCLNVIKGKNKRCGLCKLENTYIFTENHVRGILKNGNTFLIDKDDYERVKEHKWNENDEGYVCTLIQGSKTFLHRILLNLPPYSKNRIVVDHINHNIKDNRKSNLRLATKSQNKMNNTGNQNKSGFIGVGWHQKLRKYYVRINIDKVETHMGYFEDIEDAIRARLMAEKKYYGEFAPQRYLFEQYGV